MEDQQSPSEDHHLPSDAARNTVIFGKYETGRLLGKGTFAKVKKEGFMEQIEREISMMRLVRHPNVVEITEVMATKQKIFFVMEYVKDGELFAKIAKGKLKEDAARNS